MAGGDVKTKKRKVAVGSYASFKLQKKIKVSTDMPSAFRLFTNSLKVLKKNWKVIGGIALWYGVLNMVLVQTVSSGDVSQAKKAFSGMFDGTMGDLATGAGSFLYLLGVSGNVASAAGIYQLLLVMICSLAFIWAYRRIYTQETARIRDAFYEGMYPLIPFFIVLLVISLQLMPLIAGGGLFTTVMNNGITSGPVEVIAWATLFFLLATLSLYMVTSSIFALYAVSLPHMTPLKALRTVRPVVAHRRWTVLRKILFLPFVLLVLSGIILVPLILTVPAAVVWVFYLVMILCVVIAHGYMYELYRALIRG